MTPVQATQILRDNHKRLTGLMRQLTSSGRRAHEMKRGIANEVYMELDIHSAIEEQIFYPALLAALGSETALHAFPSLMSSVDASSVDHAIRDHREVKETVQRLRQMHVEQEDFDEAFDSLVEIVEAHMSEEEQMTFPAAEQLLKEDLSPLGAQMQDLRDDLLRQPQYRAARAQYVQNPNGGEQMRKDQRLPPSPSLGGPTGPSSPSSHEDSSDDSFRNDSAA